MRARGVCCQLSGIERLLPGGSEAIIASAACRGTNGLKDAANSASPVKASPPSPAGSDTAEEAATSIVPALSA